MKYAIDTADRYGSLMLHFVLVWLTTVGRYNSNRIDVVTGCDLRKVRNY